MEEIKMIQMIHLQRLMIFLLLFITGVGTVSAAYQITLETTPEHITARDNPFAHYDDLGALPEVVVSVKDTNGNLVEDLTISATITHIDNLLLPTGFPWVEGKQLLSVTVYEEEGTLTIPALLFPLRGEYTVDVKVMDVMGNQQTEQFTIEATEPFAQSTWNAIIFLSALFIFGLIVGLVFGKDFLRKKAQASISRILTMFVVLTLVTLAVVPIIAAHSDEDMEATGIVHYEDSQITFYTTPEMPDIGKETTFTFDVLDENGMPVNNALAHVTLENEEEGFEVLELELFSQTGTFTFNYGIFDGAPHIATIYIQPTMASSTQFAEISRAYAFAGEAHNPPFGAKLLATTVMLATMLVGFAAGILLRKMTTSKAGEAHE